MTNFRDLYEEILRDPLKWSYYDIHLGNMNSIFQYVFNRINPDEFIIDILKRGGKENISCVEQIRMLSIERKCHTISCFLLGNEIYNKSTMLQKYIDESFEKIRKNDSNEDFPARFRYIWMLISSFHDLGYSIEEGKLNGTIRINVKDAFRNLPSFKCIFFDPYCKSLAKKYCKYRQMKWNCIDHGIAGGSLLYKDLCALRQEKEKTDKEHFWGKALEKDFLYASWVIAFHNIYKIMPNDKMEMFYRYFKLESLITSKRLITKDTSPLLFLLCLVDSIEPIKQVDNLSLLKTININITKEKIIIDLSNLNDIKLQCEYLGNLLTLNTWLTDVSIKGNSIAIITI